MSAFAAGLRRHGWKTTIAPAYAGGMRADLCVTWGVRRRDQHLRAMSEGAEICVLERGYVGDRLHWSSVSFGGGLNGRALFRGPFSDGTRWGEHFAKYMQPWRQKPDGYVLVCGQVSGDCSLKGVDIDRWYADTIAELRAAGHDVRFRPHPLQGKPAPRLLPPLAEDLAGARYVVTFNSNSGVDAVLAGVPTVAQDEGSMVYSIAGHDRLAMPPTPYRTSWAHALAWCQWSREEMERGDCWEAVGMVRANA